MNPDPQPGQLWSTPKGHTVEILAREVVDDNGDWSYDSADVIAYRFLGGSMVHLRAASSLAGWVKVVC